MPVELVFRPSAINVNDDSHSPQHGVYEMVKEFYIQRDLLPCM